MAHAVFKQTPSPFGHGTDEASTQEAFVEYVGGRPRAEQLSRLWSQSYAHGTQYDKVFRPGMCKTREQVFHSKARAAGFSECEIAAFLSL